MDWISVDEQSPKKRGEYLTWQPQCTLMGHQVEERYSILRWSGSKFFSSMPVTHWMPLPKPPNGKGK